MKHKKEAFPDPALLHTRELGVSRSSEVMRAVVAGRGVTPPRAGTPTFRANNTRHPQGHFHFRHQAGRTPGIVGVRRHSLTIHGGEGACPAAAWVTLPCSLLCLHTHALLMHTLNNNLVQIYPCQSLSTATATDDEFTPTVTSHSSTLSSPSSSSTFSSSSSSLIAFVASPHKLLEEVRSLCL